MGIAYNPKIVTNGLVLCLDAANPRSFLSAVEYLIVAGGGGGGGYVAAGGGGGGGVLTSNAAITLTNYTVTVGAGGTGGPSNRSSNGGNGGNSSAFGLTAIGGGGGGRGWSLAAGNTGGSAGGTGGGDGVSGAAFLAGTAGTAGQGNSGGGGRRCTTNSGTSGGGGGAGSAGTTPECSPRTAGAGGQGISSSISGNAQLYAGGGGGDSYNPNIAGVGGLGGGGNGNGSSGVAGTGGGGGSAGSLVNPGGTGGSGIVIVRYPGPQRATGGTVTSVNGDTVHTFTASGTFTPNIISDLSDNGNNGALVNGVGYSSADAGYLTFDGVDDFVNGGTNAVLNVGNNITANAWFYVNSNSLYQPIVSKVPSDFSLGWEVANSSGTFRTTFRPSATLINLQVGSLVVGNWYMGTMTFDGTTARLYLNGTQTGSTTTGGPVTLNSTQQLQIGTRGAGDVFNGNISSVSIYNRALTAQEIQQNFEAMRSRYGI
jgi:hypothetical protein